LKPARFMVAKSTAEARVAMSARVDPFDLIILAIKNPPSSGFHYLQEIRTAQIPRTPAGTRVIFISAPLNQKMIELAKSLDVDGFIAIPVTVASVNNTLSAALKREREAKSAAEYNEIKLPKLVAKKPPEEIKKETGPNARIVWSEKDKEKAELLRTLKESLAQDADGNAVEPAKIDNVRTFWLKDLMPGMVLAEEINGEKDELLLATGTLLNASLIEKIKKFSELGVCRSFLKAGSAPPK
jgi:DNA-binding NarL/FixJ family response regulator